MQITYFNNCWFTNVGEGFIYIGAYELIKRVFGEKTSIVTVTTMSDWYVEKNENRKSFHSKLLKKYYPKRFESEYLSKTANLFDLYKSDYFVLSGMFASESFLNAKSSKMLLKLAQQGTKIIFLGMGGRGTLNKRLKSLVNI